VRSEKAIQADIVKHLRASGAWVFKVHGGPMQLKGVPDLVGCWHGVMFALEVKKPGERLTAIQAHIIEQIKAAGGVAGRVECVADVEALCCVLTTG
jgi:Holliday junction resolvase